MNSLRASVRPCQRGGGGGLFNNNNNGNNIDVRGCGGGGGGGGLFDSIDDRGTGRVGVDGIGGPLFADNVRRDAMQIRFSVGMVGGVICDCCDVGVTKKMILFSDTHSGVCSQEHLPQTTSLK